MMLSNKVTLEMAEPELRAVLEYMPLDFYEDGPLGVGFRKLTNALTKVVVMNDWDLRRRKR